ncbi:MAG: Trigger factor [candidate division CPR1 bacterium GW2011_GWC1_49_13]|uniref:Trigger factor n=1 Tax=candidate division CPR1 bacterium GW2011_GWC1_49_13 TaxID=1618342 RepID=A0A0G1VGU7_9BACT|nr:MAG: Trigger factor [candidate division CPR1 bacterium GW2011_GWC1_49_13]
MAEVEKKEIIKREGSQVTLTITVPKKDVSQAFQEIKKRAVGEVKVSGFRPGKAPTDLAEKQLNEEALAQDLFQEVVPLAYARVVSQEKLKPIIPPQITVKEYGRDQDLVFEATTAEAPKVSLGDYKKAVSKLKGSALVGPDGKPLSKDGEVTAAQALESLRGSVKIEIPHILVDYEVQRMLSSLIDQVRSLGMTIEQYLTSQGKKAEDLQKEYHEIAERNLKDEFILREVAETEGVKVEEKEISDAIEAAPDEKTKLQLGEDRGRAYLEDVLKKRKVIENLLKLTGKKS